MMRTIDNPANPNFRFIMIIFMAFVSIVVFPTYVETAGLPEPQMTMVFDTEQKKERLAKVPQTERPLNETWMKHLQTAYNSNENNFKSHGDHPVMDAFNFWIILGFAAIAFIIDW